MFPSANAIRGKSQEPLNDEKQLSWLSNQSFHPHRAQATALSHGGDGALAEPSHHEHDESQPGTNNTATESRISVTHSGVHCDKEEGEEYNSQQLVPPDVYDQDSAESTGDAVVKTEKRDLSKERRPSPSISSDGSSEEVKRETVSEKGFGKIKEEGRQQRSGSRRHKRSRDDSHRHEKRKKKKRHHRSDSSPEVEHKRHKRKESRHKAHKRDEAEETSRTRPSSIWIDDFGSIPDTPFYLDEKPDKNNLCFSSLNFTDAAFYHRQGKSCLGLDSKKQSVQWGEKKKEKNGKKHRIDSSRYFHRANNGDGADEDCQIQTVALDVNGKRIESNTAGMPYIPLDTQALKAQASLNAGEQPLSGAHDMGDSTRAYIPGTTAFYNKHLHENPHDIPKWIEFLHFQDQALLSNDGTPGAVTNAATLKISKREGLVREKKQAILEKALKLNPLNAELQLEQVELCRDTWDSAKLAKQWDGIIRQHSEDLAMWREYLAFSQSCFTKFTVSGIASTYSDYLKAVEVHDIKLKFDIVLQLCHFWRQSGHVEKAVALLQALLEFNCFCPEGVKESTTLEGKIAFFETFWDSNEPRFGQTEAEGWAKWMHKKEKGGWSNQAPVSNKPEEDEPVIIATHSKCEAWLREEVHRDHAHFLPWQPNPGETEDDCEDPDRMVLFDDISPFLLNLETLELKYKLVLSFLDFLGVTQQEWLTCLQESAPASLEHPAEVFRSGDGMRSISGGLLISGKAVSDVSGKGTMCTMGNVRDRKAVLDFADNIVNQSMKLFPQEGQNHLKVLQMQYNLQPCNPTESSKKQKKHMKECQKYAKKLLSQENNRNNLLLWAEYAKWEWCNGNLPGSQRIFETALAFSQLNPVDEDDEQEGVTKLLSTYASLRLGITLPQSRPLLQPAGSKGNIAEMSAKVDSEIGVAAQLDEGKALRQDVLHALTTFGERGKFVALASLPEKHVSAGRILKARKGFVDLYNKTVESSREAIRCGSTYVRLFTCLDQGGSKLVHTAHCYALFQYLSVGMQAAGVVYEEILSHLEGLLLHVDRTMDDGEKGVVHRQLEVDAEKVTMLYVRVVSFHVRSNPMPLTLLRNLLHRAVMRYGQNPELLQTLIQLEARCHIAGRLRRFFDKATAETRHPIPWLYAISAELGRLHKVQADQEQYAGSGTGVIHRLRSLFDRATSSRHTRHCVLLWRLSMQFEVQHGDPKRGKAIFFRALQHCPWAKILYLDAVRFFPEELQEVVDLLMEKELRLRAPIEEIELLLKVAISKTKT